ncbi:MAG: hypothetical protein A3H96_08575 [Acidobacteria bacterium RIFCSPLOWO2_02_FULL_67_36]|nr:MAG: hypothetical protein A3H96_08575 [Acidobacteria bacterium RIFCSPLOWO2_02_FULL_67_36]OFW22307.1 MAG: hypothetical protein A3G21_01855 [Acidobacteria bacterium RIFCSPLOWO2_12_FULL_66_21]
MLLIFPFLVWVAAGTSAILVGALWYLGELSGRRLALSLGSFVVAGYCQFFAASAIVAAVGLLLQTMLAVLLIVRWRLIQ